MDADTRENIASAIGRIPSGLGILTAAHGGRSTGMLASWFQQVSFEPLMIAVCVKTGRPIADMIGESGAFVLNILGEDSSAMLKHFGQGFAPDEDAFAGLDIDRLDEGVRLNDAIAFVACDHAHAHETGDNQLFVGSAVGGDGDATQSPYIHVRKSGLHY